MTKSPCKSCKNNEKCTLHISRCDKWKNWFCAAWKQTVIHTKKVMEERARAKNREMCDEYSCEWWSRKSGACTMKFGIDCAKNKFSQNKIKEDKR